MRAITGWHVLGMFLLGFGTIIAVNLTLALNAVRTFPGLEVKNSYVASQEFNEERAAQEALSWDVSATLQGDLLTLRFARDGVAVVPLIERAVFGRATSVAADQAPAFTFRNGVFTAPVVAGEGNWNLRVVARSANGTLFKQRIVVKAIK
ncbi:MAG: FixH family protein [Pseudomonadota bacterium]